MTTRAYGFREEPRGAAYTELLDAGVRRCRTALLVVPSGERPERLALALKELAQHLEYEGLATFWPGTQQWHAEAGDAATVLHYRVSEELASALKKLAGGLYDWSFEREFPDDLCLLTPDGRQWLTSIGHERDAMMWLDDEERAELAEVAPTVSELLSEVESELTL